MVFQKGRIYKDYVDAVVYYPHYLKNHSFDSISLILWPTSKIYNSDDPPRSPQQNECVGVQRSEHTVQPPVPSFSVCQRSESPHSLPHPVTFPHRLRDGHNHPRLHLDLHLHQRQRNEKMAFITTAALPKSSIAHSSTQLCSARRATVVNRPASFTFTIEAAKHAQFKAAKKAERKRPRKHRPSDINRAPPSFDPEPLRAEGLPSVYSVIPADSNAEEEPVQESAAATTVATMEPPQTEEPTTESEATS